MCGIYGILALDGSPAAPDALRTMGRVTLHRGPDDQGTHCDGSLAFGMRRLSIIDVAGGHQPLSNEDGSLWLVVTPHAGGGFPALPPERVAVLARRRLRSCVERCCDRRMAALAQRGGWPRELAVAVTVGAGHLAEVRCATRAVAQRQAHDLDEEVVAGLLLLAQLAAELQLVK